MLTECFYSPNPINMRLAILLYLSIVASSVTARTTDAIIVDADTGTPLPKASVFDINGNLIGICSDNGHLPYISASDYPISISYVGYETASVDFLLPIQYACMNSLMSYPKSQSLPGNATFYI